MLLQTVNFTGYRLIRRTLNFSEAWPKYLQLPRYNSQHTLLSSNEPVIEISLVKGSFQDSLVTLFSTLATNV